MRRSSLPVSLALGALLSLSTSAARADDDEKVYPLSYVARPMTLSSMSLAPEGGVDVTHSVIDPASVQRDLGTNLAVSAGVGFGITSSLEIRATMASLQIKPTVAYGDPSSASPSASSAPRPSRWASGPRPPSSPTRPAA